MSDSLRPKLDRLRMGPPIDPAGIDLTVNDPERLRAELGSTFSYFGRVESEVAAEPLLVMMPRLGTVYRGYRSVGPEFLDVWVDQEQAHGAVFDRLQRHLDLTPADATIEVSAHGRLAGVLGRLSASLHAVFEMIYLARGAMHEKLTFLGYQSMADKVRALRETALYESVIVPIRRQEAGHLGYYRQAALELKRHLSPWQLALARRISVLTYAPVGAGSPADKERFGHVALALAGECVEQHAESIQSVAARLLERGGETRLPRFVLRSLRTCIDAAREARAATATPALAAR